MGFISSSRVLNIVMTLFFRKEEDSKKKNKLHSRPPLTFSSPSYLCLFLPMPFYLFCLTKPPFSVKIKCNMSRPAAASRCLIGAHSESICHSKRHLCLSLCLPSLCSDSALSFRLRCSIIRGWGLHQQVPSSEEFIQPLPQ